MNLQIFYKGCCLECHWILTDLLLFCKGIPLRISSDFDGFAASLQRAPLREFHQILYDFRAFRKEYPLRIPLDVDKFATNLQGVSLSMSLDFE